MIIVFGNSFSHTTNLLMNPETAVTCNRGDFNQVFFAVYYLCGPFILMLGNTLVKTFMHIQQFMQLHSAFFDDLKKSSGDTSHR